MKIAVIGASIAGLTAAKMLLDLGHQVTIYEQYPESLKNQGAGIVIPVELFDGLQKQNILNNHIPIVNITKRSIVSCEASIKSAKIICEQHVAARALHWQTLYSQLKANVPDVHIKAGHRIVDIHDLTTRFDLVIGADGHNSLTAKQICNNIKSEYAGYIAWRGTLPLEDCVTKGIFGSTHESKSPFFVYDSGHCVMYLIHKPETNETEINWVFYEKRTDASLENILSMNTQTHQYQTMQRGHMPDNQRKYLHALTKVLPQIAQDIISRTSEPFIQPIYTTWAPQRINQQGNVVLIGNAAITLPPHTASGATNGMVEASEITQAIKTDGLLGVKKWAEKRCIEDSKLYALSDRMKHFLVLDTPDWRTMTAEYFEKIWATVIAGEAWYTTAVSAHSYAKPKL